MSSTSSRISSRGRVVLDLATLTFVGYFFFLALDFQPIARHFPLAISTVAFILISILTFRDVARLHHLGWAAGLHIDDDERETEGPTASAAVNGKEPADVGRTGSADVLEPWQGVLRYGGWIVGFALTIWLVGILPASFGFLLSFLLIEGRASLWLAGIASTLGVGWIILMTRILDLGLPPSVWSPLQGLA